MGSNPFRGVPRIKGRGRDVEALTDNLEVLTGAKGDGGFRAVTFNDLAQYGLATLTYQGGRLVGVKPTGSTSTGSGSGTGGTGTPPIAQPHAPENFTVTGAFFSIILQWANAHFVGYAYAEIYRSATDDFGAAVRIGTEIGTFYVDSVGPAAKYYYWIRFVNTADQRGPINGTAGTFGQTREKISDVMVELSDSISSGLLAQELAQRINLIDAPNTGLVDGLNSIHQSMVQGQNNLQQQIDAIAVGFAVNTFYQPEEPSAEVSSEGDRWFNTGDGNHPYLYINGVWVDVSDQRILNNKALIEQEQTARITAQDALATRINTVQARIDDPSTGLEASATSLQTVTSNVQSIGNELAANTQQLSQIQAIVGADFSALQEIKRVTIDSNGLTAQYMLKTDVNGYIAGYGLWNTGATSLALFNVDTFAVGRPGAVGKYPFIIKDGVTYINVAMFAEASIEDAVIANLSADKITAGILNAARIAANSLTADKIDSRGLSIKDQNGNVIISAGQQLSAAYVTGLGTLALLNALAYQDLAGAKPPIDADHTSSNVAAGIFAQGAFATLSQLNASNINTYISVASIDTALIKSLAVTNALIANGAISEAKIQNAQVTTLKIGANSVTVPLSTYASNSYAMVGGVGTIFTLATLTLDNPDTVANTPVKIDVYMTFGNLGVETSVFELRKNGVVIFTGPFINSFTVYDGIGNPNGSVSYISFPFSSQLSPGERATFTFVLRANGSGFFGNTNIRHMSMVANAR